MVDSLVERLEPDMNHPKGSIASYDVADDVGK
jgi:hypothetical protein